MKHIARLKIARIGFVVFLIISLHINIGHCQWLDWNNITSTNLTLTSVANADNEEKDMEAADLNNDGFVDVISVRKEPFSESTEPPKSDLLLMNVNGELIDQTSQYAPGFISTPTHARDVFIGDLDNDGWKDVVIANTFEQGPIYYRNLGNDANGNWLGLVDESASRFPATYDDNILICAVKGGDLTGNGSMDLYFCNYKQGGGLAKDFLLINDGNGVFSAQAETRMGDLRNSAFGTEVELKDIDNDNDLDVIKVTTLFNVAPWDNRGVIIIFNNGNGTFTNWQNASLPYTVSPYMIEVEDFNSDGKLDIFVVDDGQDFALINVTILPNQEIIFSESPVLFEGTNGFGGNVHAVDFDLDGDLDIAVADVDVDIPPCDSGREFALLQNNNGVFSNPYIGGFEWMKNVYDFAIFDLNNDGLKDFIQGNCEGYSLYLSDNCDLAPSNADFDLDGISDACDECPTNPNPNCLADNDFPTVSLDNPIPRQWNELLLESIRRDLARPTVHARNLYHTSAAMWDAWAIYNAEGCPFLLGETVDGFNCPFDGFAATGDLNENLETTISYAMYQILSHRFGNSNNGDLLQTAYDFHMFELGHDIGFTSTNYSNGSAAALGNYIGQCYINFGLQDNSNEQNQFDNIAYQPVNDPLIVDYPGNDLMTDFNRWQPLTLEIFIDQSGNVIPGSTPDFLSPEWGQVSPFALTIDDRSVFQRDGFDYWVYHDQGAPPTMQSNGGGLTDEYKWGFSMVATWSSHLDPTDGVQLNISPNNFGNTDIWPTSIADYPNFYNFENGGNANIGHTLNPITGQAYANNFVPRGDFTRVIAEYWADGPDSETPPGHWFTILNEMVADHPDFTKQFQGNGPVLDDNEWYIKSYMMMGGGMHDAAITAWGNKGWYDYLRPISALRYMAGKGQSSNAALPSYHPEGIPLQPGYIELIDANDPLAGAGNVNVGKIKFKAWRGHEVINNIDTETAGVDWILAENWVPYQRPSFVTPPFAGYVSGHSTFSSAAATILTELTGDPFFPGGLASFTAQQDEFLVFENGPSVDVVLQWATYEDAANQSALSRIWGGIHPPADDIPGRRMGQIVGRDAFDKAFSLFQDNNNNGEPDLCEATAPCDNDGGDSDGDGICDNGDCSPNNPALPAPAGSPCSDGDPNTINDVILADGCSCSGEPSNNTCNATYAVSGNTVTFSNLTNPINSIKIIYPDFSVYWECNTWEAGCNATETIINIPPGNYNISLNTYDAGWNIICNIFESITINESNCTDADNDGFCAEDDCNDFNSNLPATPGNACNDGDPNTINDEIQTDGCTCEGTIENCTDADNDGFCAEDDCNDFNSNLPATPGTACNDNDPNTINDEIQSNGCTCIGTIVNNNNCNATYSVSGSTVNFAGLTNPISAVKIINLDFTTYWECNTWVDGCNTTEAINNIPEGDYYISLNTYDDGWNVICNIFENISIQGGPCTDNDNDGFCATDDCNDNDASIPAAPETPCNDNNANTENDVILADGCTCEGTIIDNNGCNATYNVSGSTVTFSNLSNPINAIKIIYPDFTTYWECNTWSSGCNTTEAINNIPEGSYFISLNTYDAGWNVVCNIFESINISGNNCLDTDNDGTCDIDDCAPNDATLPATAGTPCDDGNANTIDDVILSDGCTCEGIIASGCNAAYSVNGNTVTFSNINDPNSAIKIVNPDFSTYWECSTFDNPCNATTTVNNIPAGSYFISLNTYDAGWNVVCNVFDAINIIETAPLIQTSSERSSNAKSSTLLSQEFLVYPNPVHDILTVLLNNEFDQMIEYELLNIEGRVVLKKELSLEVGEARFQIDVLDLEDGYYFLKLRTEENVFSKAVVKF